MLNETRVVDSCLLMVGTAYSLANIENILGVFILIIQATWITVKLIVKIVNAIKNKRLPKDIDNDVGSVINIVEDIKEAISEKDKNNEDEFTE